MIAKEIKRSFVLGDEWIYYKIYSGVKTADKILTEAILPAAEYLIKEKKIDKWFFIRYTDPDFHLRLRFHVANANNIADVIQVMHLQFKPFIEKELIWKLMTDTYQREVERYGTYSMELSETLFFYESEMIAKMISSIEGDEGETIRWLFSLRAIDNLLDNFLFSKIQKKEMLELISKGFANEFGMNRSLKMQLDKKFREQRKSINQIMNKENDMESELKPLFELLDKKTQQSKAINHRILGLNKKGLLQNTLNDLMSSYIHMLMNRLFKSKQRFHEMVVYDFLHRYYTSEIAKEKYSKTNQLA